MAIKGGVQVTGFISPTSELDIYATHKPKYGLGGYRSVEDIEERNNIPDKRREDGMLVYVKSEDKIYILKNNVWKLFTVNGVTELEVTFETINRNIKSYPYTISIDNDTITINYKIDENNSITKEITESDNIIEVKLSGSIPDDIYNKKVIKINNDNNYEIKYEKD